MKVVELGDLHPCMPDVPMQYIKARILTEATRPIEKHKREERTDYNKKENHPLRCAKVPYFIYDGQTTC